MIDSTAKSLRFKANAIVLISGKSELAAVELVEKILSSYTLDVLENQKIHMAGHLISAFHINFDPAHLSAIEEELGQALNPLNLDLAIELL